ncbi:hypothetical protein BGZ73_005459 [Actinomortierella ambigua]|nr:hypothetical protein BGZ73_005459 [Actinomortierella ambigua]
MAPQPEDSHLPAACSAALHHASPSLPDTPTPQSASPVATAEQVDEEEGEEVCTAAANDLNNLHAATLLSSSTNRCRICLDDDPHGLYSPCRCRGSTKFVHSHCLTRWRKSLMVHGREESANSCTMCGFKFVLKKRARLHGLISYRGVRILITFLVVLAMMFPAGYIMKACVILSVYNDQPPGQRQSLWSLSSSMDEMNIFPICKADRGFGTITTTSSPTFPSSPRSSGFSSSFKQFSPIPSTIHTDYVSLLPDAYRPPRHSGAVRWKNQQEQRIIEEVVQAETTVTAYKGPAAPSPSSSPSTSTSPEHQPSSASSSRKKETSSSLLSSSWWWWWRFNLPSKVNFGTVDYTLSFFTGSWAWVLTMIDVIGASSVAHWVKYPFVDDRLWHLLLCRLHHLHLGFFFLGSASNVYMACKMLSDMYDLILSPPHAQPVAKQVFLTLCSVFVLWFWFTYNLMAFRVSATEEEFMAELPLWTLRWINVGVAIVDLSYRRVYRRLGKWKVEEELLDISEVEQLEKIQFSLFQLQTLSAVQQYGHDQGQFLLDQLRHLGEQMSTSGGSGSPLSLHSLSEAVSEAYAKTAATVIPPFQNPASLAAAASSSISSAAASMLSKQALVPLCESSINTISSAFGVRRSSETTATITTPAGAATDAVLVKSASSETTSEFSD